MINFMNKIENHFEKELIQDLVNSGMSYSKIAHRIGVARSTIQKLMKMSARKATPPTIIRIGHYYKKIFSMPANYGAKVNDYYLLHRERIHKNLEIIERGL